MKNNGSSPRVGTEAPDFLLTDQDGGEWSLSAHRGKVVLVLFYPGNETYLCTKQLCSLRDNWAKYLDTKAEIVAVSASGNEANADFAQRHRLPLKILADANRHVTQTYISHSLFPVNFMRGLTVIDGKGVVRTHQTMLRAFRPNDHDVVMRVYEARSDAVEDRRSELRNRVRTLLLR